MNDVINRIIFMLEQQPAGLFAILDAARERTIVSRLRESGQTFQSLFEGAPDLEDYGPFLVEIRRNSPLLSELVKNGWGKSWGVYLTSNTPFPELRKHLRRFLMVKLPDGREAYFRFYDPRVLRTFLTRSTPAEACYFVGPAASYLIESEDPCSVLNCAVTPFRVEVQTLSVK